MKLMGVPRSHGPENFQTFGENGTPGGKSVGRSLLSSWGRRGVSGVAEELWAHLGVGVNVGK